MNHTQFTLIVRDTLTKLQGMSWHSEMGSKMNALGRRFEDETLTPEEAVGEIASLLNRFFPAVKLDRSAQRQLIKALR